MQNYQNITLDVNNCIEYEYVSAKQGDNQSRFLNMTLTENGNVIAPTEACTALFRCLKPDGRICVNNAIINSDGTITAPLTNQVLAAAGTVRADISVLDGSTVLSSATFFITVEPSPAMQRHVLSSDEFLILVEKTNEAATAIESINNISKEAQETIASANTVIMQTAKTAETAKTAAAQATEAANAAKAAATSAANAAETAKAVTADATAAADSARTVTAEITGVLDSAKAVTEEAASAIDSVKNIVDNTQAVQTEIEDIKGYIGYTSTDILGLQADFENKKFTRLAGAVGLTAGDDFDSFSLYAGMRRCNVSDDGTITAWYGDSNYAEDGSNGQVMVYVPKFYYKVVPLKLEKIENGIGYHIRKANYYITDKPLAGFKLHPAFVNEQGEEVDYFLYSAYEGSLYRIAEKKYYNDAIDTATNFNSADLICSQADRKPITNEHIKITRANAELLCKNRGAGWHCQTFKALCAIQLLMVMEYGTFNTQNSNYYGIGYLGMGTNSYSSNKAALTGSTKSLGNKTGRAESTSYHYYDETLKQTVMENKTAYRELAISYRGIENLWENTFKYIEGINAWGDGNMQGGQVYICNDFNFEESKKDDNYSPIGFYMPIAQNYISAFGYAGEEYDWAFVHSEANGTASLPVGDRGYTPLEALNKYTVLTHGGGWESAAGGGLFYLQFSKTPTYTAAMEVGFRTVYIPQN